MRSPKIIAAITLVAASLPIANAQTTAPALSGDQVVERVSPSAVSILAGKGDGQVAGVASGVIIRSDGVIPTASQVVKGKREGQVWMTSAEIYDRVGRIASDERRELAALASRAPGLAGLPCG